MNYKQQLEVIKGLSIDKDTQARIDCPFCNGRNTLSIDTSDNKISWYCFHASCSAKGRQQGQKDIHYVQKVFYGNKDLHIEDKDFVMPDSFQSIYSNEKAMHWLSNNNCWESWSWGRADFKYDVKQDRVVFLIKNNITHKIVGAVGRALNKKDFPKWYMYGNKDVPFKCGVCDDAVIVEDCASACTISSIYTGVALLGTTMKDEYAIYLSKNFKKVIVALDRDATQKAFDLSKGLRYLIDTEVKVLEEDLKYLDDTKIKELFKCLLSNG